MGKIIVPFNVNQQDITKADKSVVAAGAKNLIYAIFDVCDVWNKIDGIRATFIRGNDSYIQSVGRNDDGYLECQIPWEVMTKPGQFYVGIFGGDRLPTALASVTVVKGSICDGNEPQPPTPDWFDTIEKHLGDKADKKELDKKLDILPSKSMNAVYIQKPDGTVELQVYDKGSSENTIAQRHAGGALYVGDPKENTDAVNLLYFNKAMDGKVPIVHNTTGKYRVYVQTSKDVVETYPMDRGLVRNTIPMRNDGGTINVGTPTENNHAVNKKFFEDGTKDFVKNTDYATTDGKAGVIVLNKDRGVFRANLSPQLEIVAAVESEISKKSQSYKPITPRYLDHAVKVGVATNTISLTDGEKKAAQVWLGVDERLTPLEALVPKKGFVTISSRDPKYTSAGENIYYPENRSRYAQILEIHGYHAYYDYINDEGNSVHKLLPNYPKEFVFSDNYSTDHYQMPDDVDTVLDGFGIEGNYIYFEDDKVYYKQTRKVVSYSEADSIDKDLWYEEYDVEVIVNLSEPIITDITDYFGWDGVIDTNTDESSACIRIESLVYYQDDVYDLDSEDDTWDNCWDYPEFKVVFEVEE